jgi:hypothetical protein
VDAITADEIMERIETAKRERICLDADERARMHKVTEEEEGVLNLRQAATCLGVTPRRVQQLVLEGSLTRWTFMGHHYVSFREVAARRLSDVKLGRPRRGILTRVKISLQAALQTDAAQACQGGFNGKRK